jgi:hypothetical protein
VTRRGDQQAIDVGASIPWVRQVAYATLLLAVALLLFELGLRARVWWKGDLPPTPDASLEYEWKWARRYTVDGRLDSMHRYDPDLGWSLRPDFDDGRVVTNSKGLRSDREYPPGRSPGRRRLALLGDSFTFGAHVANHETFAYVLERELLSGWDVPNLAVSGYGTDQALLAYELRGGDLAADVVVMGFYVRDYERSTLRFKLYAKPIFEPEAEGLRLARHPVAPPERLYEEYRSGRRGVGRVASPYLVLSLAKAWRRLAERWPRESDDEWQILSRLMRRFRDHVLAQGAAPLWLVIPYHDVVHAGRSRQAAIEEMCQREAEALGLPLLRLDAVFREAAESSPEVRLYRPREIGGHLSVEGHRLVAEVLADQLHRGLRAPDQGAARAFR